MRSGTVQIAGPLVGGNSTTLSIYSVSELKDISTSLLTSLFHVVNSAFRDIHDRYLPPISGGYPDRLTTPQDFITTMQDDPDTFVMILTQQRLEADDAEHTAVLATASGRPHLRTESDLSSPWVRRLGPEEGCFEWELKLLAVDPSLQRLGLAQYLMRLVEQEAIRRSQAAKARTMKHASSAARQVAASQASDTVAISPTMRVRMVIMTLKECTYNFYIRDGYREDYVVPRGSGFDFNIMAMSKDIATV